MPTHLRLHRDEPENSPPNYKFPLIDRGAGASGAGASSRDAAVPAVSRRRLVAARVAESPLEDSFSGSACAVLNGGGDPDCLGRIMTSGQLVREIEKTLDRMQGRLNDFREEMGRAFKFPQIDDTEPPPRPYAA